MPRAPGGSSAAGACLLRVVLAVGIIGLKCSIVAADASPFDYAALHALIDRGSSTSIEALLASLPTTYRSRYVLVFSSRSLQQATLRDPRVILYGDDAHLLMSFNGTAAERGYDAVETIEFDPPSGRFRFREIRSADSTSGAPRLEISEVDPERCRRCHGTPPRPLWDASPFWPGAYGERYGANLSAAERAGLALFLHQRTTHPRYAQLVDAERFAYRDTFVPEARSAYDGAEEEAPNARLSRLLGLMNIQAIATQLQAQTNYAAYRYAILGAAEGDCGAPWEFLPGSQRSAAQEEFRRLAPVIAAAGTLENASKNLRALNPSRGARAFGEAAPPSAALRAVRYLAESGLGMSAREWSLALGKNVYDFGVGPGDSHALADVLRSDAELGDANVHSLATTRDHSPDDPYCGYLREHSRAALSASALERPLHSGGSMTLATPASVHRSMLEGCAQCHSDGTAPPLPFDQPLRLATLLRRGDYARGDLLAEILFRVSPQAGAGRMPPDEHWAPQQRAELERYLRDLDAAATTGDPRHDPAF